MNFVTMGMFTVVQTYGIDVSLLEKKFAVTRQVDGDGDGVEPRYIHCTVSTKSKIKNSSVASPARKIGFQIELRRGFD
ncbi:hypothetical protein V9T40_009556 [Parthenolecanium corni]|uniref:Uncharacterized protein n=1 Tax=Parthenolecanium corni TaxID=536013 RepID=A0AAN9TN01_9HEMI